MGRAALPKPLPLPRDIDEHSPSWHVSACESATHRQFIGQHTERPGQLIERFTESLSAMCILPIEHKRTMKREGEMTRIHLGQRIVRSWIAMLVAASLLTSSTFLAWSMAYTVPAISAGNDFTNIIIPRPQA